MSRPARKKAPKNLVNRNGVWYGRVTIRNQPIQKSLETGDLEEAQRRVGVWLAEIRRVKHGDGPQTLVEALEVFAERHTRNIAIGTQRRYAVSADHLLAHFGPGKSLDDLTRPALAGFEHARAQAGVTSPTIRRDLAFLSIVLEIAGDAGWAGVNAVRAFMRQAKRRGLSEAPARDRYLSHEEEAALLSQIDIVQGWGHRKVMTRAFVILSLDLGLRHEELLRLEWVNVDLQRPEVYVPPGDAKSGLGRRVPILPRSLELLRSLPRNTKGTHVLHQRDGRGFVDGAMWRPVKRLAAAAGIPDVRPHDLRRTCGCRLLQDWRFPIEHVSKWLGHASIGVTQRHYAFLRVDDLHRSVSEHHLGDYGDNRNQEKSNTVGLIEGVEIIGTNSAPLAIRED